MGRGAVAAEARRVPAWIWLGKVAWTLVRQATKGGIGGTSSS
jgi:hypothetical protein